MKQAEFNRKHLAHNYIFIEKVDDTKALYMVHSYATEFPTIGKELHEFGVDVAETQLMYHTDAQVKTWAVVLDFGK